MNLNTKAKKQNTYDAIVVGSGISGGWAAKELTEKGLKTLVLERGYEIKHPEDYETAMKDPWDLKHRGKVTQEQLKTTKEKQQRIGYLTEEIAHMFVDDTENPYSEVKRFDWLRGYHTGGRSLMWGRQSYRWSPMDFESNAKDGFGVDWPIRYDDLAPWYDYVEGFAGISGQNEGLEQLPDGNFLPPMEMNCLEKHAAQKVRENFNDRIVTIGRVANLTVAHNGRNHCMYRNRCARGCPYGAYFSSLSSTLPAAAKTGNMTLRHNSIVNSVIYDKEQGKATGVRVIDAESGEMQEFYAKIIFLNASAVGSAFILMNSVDEVFPNGLGNTSGTLGHYLMDHHFRTGARGEFDGFADQYYSGRRANGIYIPRFRNIKEKHPDFIRGYGYQGGASRESWMRGVAEMGFGDEFKQQMVVPGPWSMGLGGFGETLPYFENKVTLDKENVDKWGQPTVKFDCEFKENEMKMRVDMQNSAAEILEAAGLKNISTYDAGSYPGQGIHEMGTCVMGKDKKTSMLNKNNQLHEVSNVFVTDGACMSSAACQNPSLTYMALTARACDFAVSELKKNNI
ncbi:GMC oxidoreductase [Chondrinema litorale]|uniref:GMC oxidoreductase n=1 Tax=Chondrinema litorale TaxID=2994555 RepID=UPI002542B776|nr:GMC family oxidoreductase [Chondrinema litorale]UZR95732.1 GMC family oxidoreductase [Chondrinema litorale]